MFARLLMPKFSTKFRPRNEPGRIVLDVDVTEWFFAKWYLAKKKIQTESDRRGGGGGEL